MTSPPLRWSDLRGLRVGVWGVGSEGRASLRRLQACEVEPFAVVDDNPSEPWVLGTAEGGLRALLGCDVVIKSPGVSRYAEEVKRLEAQGVAVVGGMGLWLEQIGTGNVIAITGTKGKSTTTSVAGHLASAFGRTCFVGGNLGRVPWDTSDSPTEFEPTAGHPDSPGSPAVCDGPSAADLPGQHELWIVEVSSFQATDLWSSPAVVAVTSLHPDHLDWHGSVEGYYRDKLSICGRRGGRIVVANGDDSRLVEREEWLRPGPRWVHCPSVPAGDPPESGSPSWVQALGLRGRHNVLNALIAAACLEEIGIAQAADPDRLAEAATGFRGLPHRLETVRVRDGVEYVDDSLSTNVLPTIAATDVFADRPLALIAGGFDRDIDYAPLAEHLAARSQASVVFTVPDSGDRILREILSKGGAGVACRDIGEAVLRASRWAQPGAVVLLSPAAASFGHFSSYKQRGEAFRAAVEDLGSS